MLDCDNTITVQLLPITVCTIIHAYTLLFAADKKIESYCDTFSVQTPSGQQLFYVDENEVRVGPEKIKIIGKRTMIKVCVAFAVLLQINCRVDCGNLFKLVLCVRKYR